MESFPFEMLPDEIIIKVVSHLSLWDAFAMETTSKRMFEVVRAHQKVQPFVDIAYPTSGFSQYTYEKGVQKTLLTRFGPNLLKMKVFDAAKNHLFDNEHFIEKLASACPNLIELPTTYMPALFTFVSSSSGALRKIVIGRGLFTAAQVKHLLLNSPQLEDLTIDCNDFREENNKLLKAIEASMPLANRIRKLHVYFIIDSETLLTEVLERLISKLRHLVHLSFSIYGHWDENDLFEEKSIRLKNILSKINCSKSLELARAVPLTHAKTLAAYVTRMSLSIEHGIELASVLGEFTNLKRLRIVHRYGIIPMFNNDDILVLPQTVRDLRVCLLKPADVKFMERCICRQGEQLESIKLAYDPFRPSYQQILWTNQLLVALAESCAKLKSLYISGLELQSGFDSQQLRTFVQTCGKSLEHLHIKGLILSLPALELVSVECKSLKSLVSGFAIENEEDKSQMVQLEKLLKGMTNLYKAKIKIKTCNSSVEKPWETGPYCSYANCKFVLVVRK